MSETLVQRPTPVDLEAIHRETPTREVINVDDLDFAENVIAPIPGGRARASNTRPRPSTMVIDLDDMSFEEEIQEVAGPSNARPAPRRPLATMRARQQPRRRTLFSPSPPAQDNTIPPVPPLPRRLPEPPLRYYGPPDFGPGPFRPLDRPFAFEDGFRAAPRQHEHQAEPRLRTHHPPHPFAIGPIVPPPDVRRGAGMPLGGALVALNRQREGEAILERLRQVQQGRNRRNDWSVGNVMRRLLGGWVANEADEELDDEDADLLDALAMSAAEHEGAANNPQWHDFRMAAAVGRRHHREDPMQSVDYKISYTHPSKPERGFSNDFAPAEPIVVSDKAGSSASGANEAGTILVCARCLDPLVMNVVGTADTVRKSKLWALRCGHMLDGKCIEKLMVPMAVVEVPYDPVLAASSVKGKGKEVARGVPNISSSVNSSVPNQDMSDLNNSDGKETPTTRHLGKRKATELEGDVDIEGVNSIDEKGKGGAPPAQEPTASSSSFQLEPGSPSSMRSRLRSRTSIIQRPNEYAGSSQAEDQDTLPPANETSATPTQWTAALAGAPAAEAAATSSSRARGRRGRGRGITNRGRGGRKRAVGKGKGKAKAPVIEEEYEWACPVVGCARKHLSVKIDGVWKPEEDRNQGAIAVYV